MVSLFTEGFRVPEHCWVQGVRRQCADASVVTSETKTRYTKVQAPGSDVLLGGKFVLDSRGTVLLFSFYGLPGNFGVKFMPHTIQETMG